MNAIIAPDALLDPLTKCLTPDVARNIIESRLDPAIQAHIDDLASKANRGTLTASEREQYSEFVEYLDVIAIFKAKARHLLQHRAS